MIRNLKSSKMEKMLITEQEKTIPKGVILPETFVRYAWDFILLLQTIAFIFIIPYQVSFLDSGVGLPHFVLDTCMDALFFMDVYARLRKFAIMKDGFLLVERAEFRQVYLNTDFRGDLLSIIPASTIGYFFGFQNTSKYGVLRAFQFVRVRHFGRYLSTFVENINSKGKFKISTAQLRIIQIFFIVLFLCHWFACVFHLIGHIPSEVTWLVADESMDIDNGGRYLRSFYWSLYTGE